MTNTDRTTGRHSARQADNPRAWDASHRPGGSGTLNARARRRQGGQSGRDDPRRSPRTTGFRPDGGRIRVRSRLGWYRRAHRRVASRHSRSTIPWRCSASPVNCARSLRTCQFRRSSSVTSKAPTISWLAVSATRSSRRAPQPRLRTPPSSRSPACSRACSECAAGTRCSTRSVAAGPPPSARACSTTGCHAACRLKCQSRSSCSG